MSKKQIHAWMVRNLSRFIDNCDEVNCTKMVETWDDECADGETTLGLDHPAWDIAVDVSVDYEEGELGGKKRRVA